MDTISDEMELEEVELEEEKPVRVIEIILTKRVFADGCSTLNTRLSEESQKLTPAPDVMEMLGIYRWAFRRHERMLEMEMEGEFDNEEEEDNDV